jgi:ABC-type transport system involved in multi-copper enzyme maturation permease subunit
MSAEPQGTNLETTAPLVKQGKITRWRNPFKRMLDNPVVLKELRGRMRGKQAFVLLTVYLGVIALLIGVIYFTLANQSSYGGGWDPSFRQTVGKSIFGAVVLLELLLVSFIGPGLTAGAITAEREHQTFDLLRTTLLSARSLVLGKLGSAFTYLFLLILTALPIQSIAFLLGGVGLGEMVIASLMLVVTALFYCTLGIFFSSFMKRTLTATVTSYGTIVLSFLLIIIAFFVIAYIESLPDNSGPVREFIMNMLVWTLVSTNPFLAAILTEVILVEEQSLFITTNMPFGSSFPPYFPSPWIIFTIFYLLLTLVMIVISIYRVKRPDR